jgi:hypothetical protein
MVSQLAGRVKQMKLGNQMHGFRPHIFQEVGFGNEQQEANFFNQNQILIPQ